MWGCYCSDYGITNRYCGYYYGFWASVKDTMFVYGLNIDYLFKNLVKKCIPKPIISFSKRSFKWVTGGIRLFQH